MLKAERQERILELLGDEHTASVRSVAEQLAVSEMTVRRDFEELAERGVVERVYGGARLRHGTAKHGSLVEREFTHGEKARLHAAEKRDIARRAAALIGPRDTVFLGAGTTIEQMVSALPEVPFRIVTNGLAVFSLLEQREGCDLCLVGGTYRSRTHAFVGPMAEDAIASLGIDKAFIGANGVTDGSIFTSNAEEGRFQRLVFGKANERYLLADSSKVGRRDFYGFFDLGNIDTIFTDAALTGEQRFELEQYTRVER